MTSNSNIGRVLEGKYEIVRVLGEGGMGEVYEARHQLIQRRLAIKLLRAKYARDAEIVERFTREARASAAIGHEHIVAITDMGVADSGELFIVMEYLDGQDLEHLLREKRPLSVERACHIMIQVLSALEAAHAKGIVHRDLKPANVFLTTHAGVEDYAKIVDFGISKVRDTEGAENGLTKTGILLGTPSYMSPEQALAQGDINSATDIFSAGVILYEMVTGKLPFEASSMPLVLAKILKHTPPDPVDLNPAVPRELSDSILHAMDKEVENRFLDAAAFRREITPFSPETDVQTGLATTRLTARAADFHGSVGRNLEEVAGKSIPRNENGLATTPLTVVTEEQGTRFSSSKWRIVPASMMAALILIGVGLVVFRWFQDDSRRAAIPAIPVITPSESTQAKPTPPLEMVVLRIEAVPSDAQIIIDGETKGSGTFVGEFQKGEQKKEVLILAEGYEENRQEVVLMRSVSMVVTLKKAGHSAKRAKDRRKNRKSSQRPESSNRAPKKVQESKSSHPQTQKNPRTIDEVAPW